MISLGGTIGTGLFLTSGASIAQAGPGGALVAYAATGIMVFFMMESLGEMATYLPISGSFNNYAGRFIDPALGFALGWNVSIKSSDYRLTGPMSWWNMCLMLLFSIGTTGLLPWL
jgi:amino acid permease